jgi:broad specificity phosphatase PhoE
LNRLYLVRHGENKANLTKEFSYRKVDYSLTEKGILQSQQTAEYFKDKQVDEIYSSPLKRAIETAEIIARTTGGNITILENFREINVGDLEDRPPTDENWRIYGNVIKEWYNGRPEASFPGGENYIMLTHRLREGVEQIVEGKDDKNIVVVAHGGVFVTVMIDLCRNVKPEDLRGAHYHNCAISEIEVSRANGELVGELIGWGACFHLSGEAADLVSALPDSYNLEPQK